MKNFVLGFVAALVVMISAYFLFQGVIPMAEVGRIMDEDVIYLKSGDIVHGWIIDERPGEIFIETKDGFYTLPKNNCLAVKKNVVGRYLRDLP